MNTTNRTKRIRSLVIGVSLGTALLTAGTGFIDNSNTAYAATANSTVSAASTSSLAEKIIATGMKYKGVKYEYGAEAGNTSSFDCSSFTQYIFGQHGVTLSRSSKQQSTDGTSISRSQLQPGDLVFFYSPIHHVAVYIGDGKILHTYGEGGVTVTDLDSGWWDEHYTSARRVLPEGTQAGNTTSDSTTGTTADKNADTATSKDTAADAASGGADSESDTATDAAPDTSAPETASDDAAPASSGGSSQGQPTGFDWGWLSNFR